MSTHPGAVWHRVDLQCHTPRDLGWAGSPSLPGGSLDTEGARRDWARQFVAAALDRGLSVVAVTDHHDIAFLPYVRAAAAETDGKLLVLPGIEITCRDAVQCLAIFEPDTDHAHLQRLLTKLPSVAAHHESYAKTAQTTECGLTVAELFEQVFADAVLAPKVLLLPHFGNPAAHKSLNDDGFAARARELPIDAVYIECPFTDLDTGTLNKIQGRQPEWGTRRRAYSPRGTIDGRRGTGSASTSAGSVWASVRLRLFGRLSSPTRRGSPSLGLLRRLIALSNSR